MEEEHFGIRAPGLTGALAVLVGLGYLIIAISHFLMPVEQLHFASGLDSNFFRSLAVEPGMFKLHYWAMALTALGATAVVMGLGHELPDWFQWIRLLALAGYIVTAINFVAMQYQALQAAPAFTELSTPVKQALVNGGIGNLDPTGLFSFGLVGLWLTFLNILALKQQVWGPTTATLGMAGGILAFSAFLGTVFHLTFLVDVAAGIGAGLLIPLWYFNLGWQIVGSKRIR